MSQVISFYLGYLPETNQHEFYVFFYLEWVSDNICLEMSPGKFTWAKSQVKFSGKVFHIICTFHMYYLPEKPAWSILPGKMQKCYLNHLPGYFVIRQYTQVTLSRQQRPGKYPGNMIR